MGARHDGGLAGDTSDQARIIAIKNFALLCIGNGCDVIVPSGCGTDHGGAVSGFVAGVIRYFKLVSCLCIGTGFVFVDSIACAI